MPNLNTWKKILLLFTIALSCHYYGYAQKKNELRTLKFYEDDDFLNFRREGTDRGYTSGLKIELYYIKHTRAKFPSNLLMKIGGNDNHLYGWGLNQDMYTPSSIAQKNILYGDRPYCGVTYLSHILISSDEEKQKLTTSLGLGLIGEYSLAGEAQSWVHGLFNYQKPKGWDNQISSDIIINYAIQYEHLLFQPTPNLEIITGLHANAGTLYNNMGLGLQFRAGLFNNYFSNYEQLTFRSKKPASVRKFQFYIYMKTLGTAVMDDATLQGGFFNHSSSPYVISKDSISRFTMQYEYGIVLAVKRLGFSISEKLRTQEFKGSYAQQVGNITLYIGL